MIDALILEVAILSRMRSKYQPMTDALVARQLEVEHMIVNLDISG